MICSRRSVAAWLLVVALAPGARAGAQSADKRAEEALSRGTALFKEGRYADAIEELRAGYVLSPQPRFLYALGQAYRMNHQCKEAVKSYRDFIHSDPSKKQVEATQANIRRCGEEDPASLEEPKPAPPPAPPPSPPPAPAPAPQPVIEQVITAPPPPPPPKPVYKKWWLWTTVGVAVAAGVGLGVGLGLGLHHDGFSSTLPPIGPGAQ